MRRIYVCAVAHTSDRKIFKFSSFIFLLFREQSQLPGNVVAQHLYYFHICCFAARVVHATAAVASPTNDDNYRRRKKHVCFFFETKIVRARCEAGSQICKYISSARAGKMATQNLVSKRILRFDRRRTYFLPVLLVQFRFHSVRLSLADVFICFVCYLNFGCDSFVHICVCFITIDGQLVRGSYNDFRLLNDSFPLSSQKIYIN